MRARIMLIFLLLLAIGGPTVCSQADTEYLELVNSSIQDGSIMVDQDITVELEFSNKLYPDSESLSDYFHFYLQGTEPEKIEFTAQLAGEQQNSVKIIPLNQLKPKANYRLVITSKLKSMDGKTLGEDMEINFITKGVDDVPYYLALVLAIALAAVYIFVIKK